MSPFSSSAPFAETGEALGDILSVNQGTGKPCMREAIRLPLKIDRRGSRSIDAQPGGEEWWPFQHLRLATSQRRRWPAQWGAWLINATCDPFS